VPRLSPALAVGAAAIVATVGCLSACGPLHEGAAATVGNTRISVAALNAAVAKATAAPASAAPTDRTTTVQSSLTALIQGDLIADGAKQKGVTVSESDIQAFLATQRKTNGTDAGTAQANGIALSDLHQAVYEALLLNKLIAAVAPGQSDQTAAQTALTDYLGAVAKHEGISVNPRYGAWNVTQFNVVPSDPFASPAASVPVASAAAS
jgi:hypothetical protein